MISRERVLIFLREKQEFDGGYSGNDLTKLAELLMVTPFGLRRRLSFWIKTDKEFSQFIYLGKEKPPITLFEFFKIVSTPKGMVLTKPPKFYYISILQVMAS